MAKQSEHSSFIEKLIEHQFILEILKWCWRNGKVEMEVLRPEVDNGGFDIVLQDQTVTRHVQIKCSGPNSTTSQQKVNIRLANRIGGCIVWIQYREVKTGPELETYLWFGEAPENKLDLSSFKIAKHTKADASGKKKLRPNIRVIPKRNFEMHSSMDALMKKMFP